MCEGTTAQAAREFVQVSEEMTLLLGGAGSLRSVPLPPQPITLSFALDGSGPSVAFDCFPTRSKLAADARIIVVIQRSAFERVGGVLREATKEGFHLSTTLRSIAVAIRDCDLTGEALKVYRLGKSIELLCETIRAMRDGEFVPLANEAALSLEDARRVAAARRMIDERCGEKLTLDKIARACGLNRAKLTRGFRHMFNCTIAEAIAEQRLNQAKRMLLTTDKPVSSIGYENGYLNNASFARAFGRRFGLSPSDYRACQSAA